MTELEIHQARLLANCVRRSLRKAGEGVKAGKPKACMLYYDAAIAQARMNVRHMRRAMYGTVK